ncbi:FAD dependent oxidoreductase [Phanerochaete sordida]|uniref:FAD dependent oxidoreductase n=1 Tax=Phanerochaete sordida TaxID=48140 RepID=A0A9P3GSI9_9APHY|nr:FAD dependent oxidoreductase [Phanerochaete sordida]
MSELPVPLNVRAEHQVVFERPTSAPPPTLPVANGTQSFWLRNPNVFPPPTYGSDGPLTRDADICIIGSGITGVSAAYHLAQAFSHDQTRSQPVSAVVLEAREFCSGATGRNGGHLTAYAYNGFRWLRQLYGEDEAVRGLAIERYTAAEVFRILKENAKVEHVDFVPGGRVILLFTAQEHDSARADYDAAKEAGIDLSDVEWLSREEVKARFGAAYPAVVIPGNNLWPLKLVSVLYNLAANATDNFNVSLHTRTPVTSISASEPSASRRWSLQTPRGTIQCSYVLHATNAYTAHLLPWMHGPDGIVPTRGQVIAVRANTPDALGRAGFVGNDGLEYWFPRQNPELTRQTGESAANATTSGQLILLGGGREATKDRGFEFYQADDSEVNPEVGAVLRRFLPVVFPGKFDEDSEVEMEWTGVMGYTKSHEPFVGPVIDPHDPDSRRKYEGQYISAGYTGHGMPRAFACAEAVAGMIRADMTRERWQPPQWFPTHYLTTQDV